MWCNISVIVENTIYFISEISIIGQCICESLLNVFKIFFFVDKRLCYFIYLFQSFLTAKALAEEFLFHTSIQLLQAYNILSTIALYLYIQYSLHFTDRFMKYTYAIEQAYIYVFLNGSLDYHVVDMHNRRLLTETVNSTNSLFNNHWIPWQIIVDHRVTKLHIQALASYL